MSSVKLLLSGSLVASGLILGAFTLRGDFDPQWRAAGRHDSAVNAFQTTTRFAPRKAEASAAARRRRAEKWRAEKVARTKPVQQSTLQWPLWNWFGK